MNLPTKDGAYEIPDDVLDSYRLLYPTADYEFARMRIWLEGNPTRRPKGAPKFIANWFKKLPQRSPRMEARDATLAALTGRDSNVVSIGRGSDWPTVRPHDGRLGRAKDVSDVDWRESRGGQADLGTHALPLFAASTASGG